MDVIEGLSPEQEGMTGLQETARGLMLGDVIVQIDDIPVRNQDDLLAVLESHEAGDVVEVVTLRNGQRQRYEIELLAPQSR